MNWVESEIAAVREVEPDLDAWLSCYPSSRRGENLIVGECDHRWKVVQPMRTVCRRCGVEA